MSILSNNKIIIHLDNYSFVPGDTIQGKVELAFSETVKTDGVLIGLVGTNKRTDFELSQANGIKYQTDNRMFYRNFINLLGPGEYNSQVLPFSFTIPQSILPRQAGSFDKIGNIPPWAITILNIGLSLARLQQPTYIPEFTLEGRVDIPWGLDITEKISVSIERKVEENISLPSLLSPKVQQEIEDAKSQQNHTEENPI